MSCIRHVPDLEKVARKVANLPTIESLLAEKDPNAYSEGDIAFAELIAGRLFRIEPTCESDVAKELKAIQKETRRVASKSLILAGYRSAVEKRLIQRHRYLEDYLISKAPRSQSGVLVVTVFTSPYPEVNGVRQAFSCQWNCYYCPNEPNQPRSYLLNEPGVRRANRLEFDATKQFVDRVDALVNIGHPADKVELLVLGGTWESYPEEYRKTFIRDLYFAANTYRQFANRDRWSLSREQEANESAACKIIGLTLETRPDTINFEMIRKLRELGCTRVQIGVQHTNDAILRYVNREAERSDTVRAIRILKDSCFKVDIHLMPDLPGSTAQLDKAMFDDVLFSEELQADQWKIYPCQTTPFTVIKRWYEEGKYASYGLETLIDVIKYAKRRVHPWIRLNRVIRDIPVEYVLEGVEVANLRQLLQQQLKAEGTPCRCIRCREAKGDEDVSKAVLKRRQFRSSRCLEVFLSYETPSESTIFGFLRLRFPGTENSTPFHELAGCALIRELHVYGNLAVAVVDKNQAVNAPLSRSKGSDTVQHSGIGTRLLAAAEIEARDRGYSKIAVISGVGVRHFYRSRGYELEGDAGFMVKQLDRDPFLAPHRVHQVPRQSQPTLVAVTLVLLAVAWGWAQR
jgi:ELP3 family radical SAM enzyme/protein acetyltransferase